MWRVINFYHLALVSIPFLKIYFQHRYQLVKTKQAIFWQHVLEHMPHLQELPSSLHRRIEHYLFANSMTTQWFGVLHDKKPTPDEITAGWYLALATPIADYLVDELGLNSNTVKSMIEQPSENKYDQIAHHLFVQTKACHPNPTFTFYLHKTLDAQELSLQQKNHGFDFQRIHDVTWQKGGYALLLYRSALTDLITPEEEKAVFQLGGLMQLHNDIFDLHRDIQENIQTIPSQIKHVTDLRKIYQNEIQTTINLFAQLELSKKQKSKFLLLVLLALNTGELCLDHYAGLERKSNGVFLPRSYSRAELVCDMDQLSKITSVVWKTLSHKFRF